MKAQIALVLLLLISIQTASAVTVQQKDLTLIKSQYGKLGDIFHFGDRLYVDSNGHLIIERGSPFSSADIVSVQAVTYVSTNDVPNVPLTLKGLAQSIDGQASHVHKLTITDSSGAVVKTMDFNVPSEQNVNVNLALNKLPAGTYTYSVSETISVQTGFRVLTGSLQALPYYGYVSCTLCDPNQKGYVWASAVWTLAPPGTINRDISWVSVSGLPSPSGLAENTVMYVDEGATTAGSTKSFLVTSAPVPIATNPPAPTVQVTAIATSAPTASATATGTPSDFYETYNGYTITKVGNTFYVNGEAFNTIIAAHGIIDAARSAPTSSATVSATAQATSSAATSDSGSSTGNDNTDNTPTYAIVALVLLVLAALVIILTPKGRK